MNNRSILTESGSGSSMEDAMVVPEKKAYIKDASWIQLYCEVEKAIRQYKQKSPNIKIEEVRLKLDIVLPIGTSSAINSENFIRLVKDLEDFTKGLKKPTILKQAKKQNQQNSEQTEVAQNSSKKKLKYKETYTIYFHPSDDVTADNEWVKLVANEVELLLESEKLYWIKTWREKNQEDWKHAEQEFTRYRNQLLNNKGHYEVCVKDESQLLVSPLSKFTTDFSNTSKDERKVTYAEKIREENIDVLCRIYQNLKINLKLNAEKKPVLNMRVHFHANSELSKSMLYMLSHLPKINKNYKHSLYFTQQYICPKGVQAFARKQKVVKGNDIKLGASNESKNLITTNQTQDTIMHELNEATQKSNNTKQEENKTSETLSNNKESDGMVEKKSNKDEATLQSEPALKSENNNNLQDEFSSQKDEVKTGEVLTKDTKTPSRSTSPLPYQMLMFGNQNVVDFAADVAKTLINKGVGAKETGALLASFYTNLSNRPH